LRPPTKAVIRGLVQKSGFIGLKVDPGSIGECLLEADVWSASMDGVIVVHLQDDTDVQMCTKKPGVSFSMNPISGAFLPDARMLFSYW
jgi:hypothetical protein